MPGFYRENGFDEINKNIYGIIYLYGNSINFSMGADGDPMRTAPVPPPSVLIVDDEKIVRESLRWALGDEYQLHIAANARQAIRRIQQHPMDLVFLDLRLPDMNGVELLKKLKQIEPATRVIIITALPKIESAVDAMKAGAFDFLAKPFARDQLLFMVKRALARRHTGLAMPDNPSWEALAGQGGFMASVYKIIDSISPCESNVLIQGASGTGKRCIARAVHKRSKRAANPYATINCAAIPASLMESKLFGADDKRAIDDSGIIKLAHNGSLFIDNINYLSLDTQSKLLRLIQDKAFDHPRSPRPIKADVRIIAATDQNLKTLVGARLFREDLYDRLSELPIDLPLLCQKSNDIGLLLEHFLKHKALKQGKVRQHFSPHARSTLMTCDWPGNVREFEHLIERLCNRGQPRAMRDTDLAEQPPQYPPNPLVGLELKKATRAFERQHILATLREVDGSMTKAAQRLGIHRNTLLKKTKTLGIAVR